MPPLSDCSDDVVAALAGHYGQPAPPSAEADPLARLIGVALGRTVESRRVARLVAAWRDAGLLESGTPADARRTEWAEVARQLGIPLAPRTLAPVLRLVGWWAERASRESIASAPTEGLREQLLSLNGVGPALADAILLEAFDRPVYPVDRASYRILVRHGWLDPDAGIEEARAVVEVLAGADVARLASLAVWLDRLGKDFCRPSALRCERCPLRPFLPDDGPRTPGE